MGYVAAEVERILRRVRMATFRYGRISYARLIAGDPKILPTCRYRNVDAPFRTFENGRDEFERSCGGQERGGGEIIDKRHAVKSDLKCSREGRECSDNLENGRNIASVCWVGEIEIERTRAGDGSGIQLY